MAVKRTGLGRGLESLFADTGSTVVSPESGEIAKIPLNDIEPDKSQPRKFFEEKALQELANSIAEQGVIQPIIVRPSPAGASIGHIIVAGERRWRASRIAGLQEIPAIVKELTDAEAMELALIENLQREDLDPVEEALGYKQLMEKYEYTQEQAAKKLSRSRSAIANSLRLLNLPEDVLEMLSSGKLSSGHAKAILSLPEPQKQSEAAGMIVEQNLNVRKTEALCKKIAKPKIVKAPVARPSIAAEVEISLKEALGTEVKVQYKDGRGSLQIGFYSNEQLLAFAKLLGEYRPEKPEENVV